MTGQMKCVSEENNIYWKELNTFEQSLKFLNNIN